MYCTVSPWVSISLSFSVVCCHCFVLFSSSAFWLAILSPKWSVLKKKKWLALPAWAEHFIAVKPSLRFGWNQDQWVGVLRGEMRGEGRERWWPRHHQRVSCCSTWVLLYWANHLLDWHGAPTPPTHHLLPYSHLLFHSAFHSWGDGCVSVWCVHKGLFTPCPAGYEQGYNQW